MAQDLAALRIQIERQLRAFHAAVSADPDRSKMHPQLVAKIELGEKAVDIGSQALILEAAAAFGLLEDEPPAAAEPVPFAGGTASGPAAGVAPPADPE